MNPTLPSFSTFSRSDRFPAIASAAVAAPASTMSPALRRSPLAAVIQTVDWVRFPERFPVRIRITGEPPIPLRIGQTVTAAVVSKSSPTSTKISKQP